MELSDEGLPKTFQGIGPDGQPVTFRIPEGDLYVYKCPDCGGTNGGGIQTPQHPADDSDDPYQPSKVPCLWCGKGPMNIVFLPSVQRAKPPSAMVLVYQPALTCSVWEDFHCRARTEAGLVRQLKAGVKRGDWVAWRLIRIERQETGNVDH